MPVRIAHALRPPAMAVGTGFVAGDPLAGAVFQRGAAVEAGRDLDAHPRAPVLDPHQPAEVELARIVLEHTDVDLDPGGAQTLGTVCR